MGRAIEPRKTEPLEQPAESGEPTRSENAEGHGSKLDMPSASLPSGSKEFGTSSPDFCTETGRSRGDPDGAQAPAGNAGEGQRRNPRVGNLEKSDAPMVPQGKEAAEHGVTPVEAVEGRGAANGIPAEGNTFRTLDRKEVLTALTRVGYRALDKSAHFGNLLHWLKVPLLAEAFFRLHKQAATGVDGQTWAEYSVGLEARLLDLQERVHRGNYHPHPVRRVLIAKGDGKMRPLGIPALEDKIVQQAARMVLEPIYESVFRGFSYGFRPGRSQHQALDALAVALGQKVNWVLDADIKAFFDTVDHAKMQSLLEAKLSDRRMVRLLMKWLNAGVMEDGELKPTDEGTAQGASISPLLANIYLHYALDEWADGWRNQYARGQVCIVRYADDFVMGFEFEQEARSVLAGLGARLKEYGLQLHPEKTRVLEFGRFARRDLGREGKRPETFDFLGFTHIAGQDKHGRYRLIRRTSRKKRKQKLASLRAEMRRRKHEAVGEQHAWLKSVLRGHEQYYGVPGNQHALASFHREVERFWITVLGRRSQRARLNAAQRKKHRERFGLPRPQIRHPRPETRFYAKRANP